MGLLALCLCVPARAAEPSNESTMMDAYTIFSEISEGIETIREIHFNVTYVENPDVVAYIKRMKEDPKIQQAVQEEAPDPEANGMAGKVCNHSKGRKKLFKL